MYAIRSYYVELARYLDQLGLQTVQVFQQQGTLLLAPELEIGGHLVIARTTSVQLLRITSYNVCYTKLLRQLTEFF